jgi:outer membrane protein assembly factor BamB
MQTANPKMGMLVGGALLFSACCVLAQDWPQWRGPNRDNKVTGFTAPKEWPKALTQKWKVTVGQGDASPVLVGDKVYTFTREGGDEVITCLDAGSGKEVWKDKYAAPAFKGPDAGIHLGPRSTPAVAEGKVCTLGVLGKLSCLDAGSGKVVWRKDSPSVPRFHTASSPIIVDGKCIVYLGGEGSGALTAFDLASGDEKWKWTGAGAPYGSPVLATIEGTKQIVTLTASSVVGINVADGKLLWETPFKAKYANATPVINGQTVIYSGPGAGTVAVKVEKKGDSFVANPLWKKDQAFSQYNSPVLKDGLLFGLSSGRNFICMDAKTGDVLWTDKTPRGECGAVLDASPVLLALTSNSELVAFKPSNKEFAEVAKYKVADSATWAYPIVAGNRVFVKDQNSVALWTFE